MVFIFFCDNTVYFFYYTVLLWLLINTPGGFWTAFFTVGWCFNSSCRNLFVFSSLFIPLVRFWRRLDCVLTVLDAVISKINNYIQDNLYFCTFF